MPFVLFDALLTPPPPPPPPPEPSLIGPGAIWDGGQTWDGGSIWDGQFVTSLALTDETGINPLPAGIRCTLFSGTKFFNNAGPTPTAAPLIIGWTQPGGILGNINLYPGATYTLSFDGSLQAPNSTITFVALAPSPTPAPALPYLVMDSDYTLLDESLMS